MGEAEKRVVGLSTYINDKGEVCIGDKCFTMGYDPETDEVKVELNSEECPDELLDAVQRMTGAVAKGAPTSYRVKKGKKK